MALAGGIYGGWLALTLWHDAVPVWLLVPLGAWLVCWHSQLQHEFLHGHPTRSVSINRALGFAPLALWLPYDRYRETHLRHHRDERLTDPLDDPESRYWIDEDWQRLGVIGRGIVRAQSTLLGRLVVGPFWAIGYFFVTEARALLDGDRRLARVWAQHLLAVAAVLVWLVLACGMSLWFYLAAFVLPGTSLMLIRSFCEHRAHRDVGRRTAIVEDFGPLAVLFLYNNLHAAHHENPRLPWYALPAWYRRNRERLIAENGGLYYRGYTEVFRKFLVEPHDQPLHPLGRVPRY
ncbi:MAG: fatty acid desaturase [Hyphomicrobiaceae bacterium]